MQIVTVSSSYLTDHILSKYFSLNELNSLRSASSREQLNKKFLGRIALKHSYTNNNFDQSIIDYNNSGEPIMTNNPYLHCTISHSYDIAVAASAPFKIGVDVEMIRSHDESLLNFISTSTELSLFKTKNKDVLVTYIWVIKEAVAKALGVGISYPFQNMIIKKQDNHYSVQVGNILWFVEVFEHKNYVISYCYPSTEDKRLKLEIKSIQ